MFGYKLVQGSKLSVQYSAREVKKMGNGIDVDVDIEKG